MMPILKRVKFRNPAVSVLMYAAVILFCMIDTAFAGGAAGGFEKIEEGVTEVNDMLVVIGVGVLSISIVFAGFKIAFQKASMGEVAPVLVGGLLIGGAASLAGWIVN